MLHPLELRSTPPLRVYCLCLLLIFGNLALASFTRENDLVGRMSHVYLGAVFAPLEVRLAELRDHLAVWVQGVSELKSMHDELLLARAQVEAKSGLAVKVSELQREVDHLRKMLAFRETRPDSFVGARVLRWNYGPFSQTIQIDRGVSSGLRVGAAVLTHAGVVGQIVGVEEDTADVMVLSDALSAVDVLSDDRRLHGIVTGIGNRSVELSFVALEESQSVVPGTRLVSSGLDGIFPKGISVGVVKERLASTDSLFVSFRVELSVDLLRLEEVLVQH